MAKRKISSFEELKSRAIRIDEDMEAYFPQYNYTERVLSCLNLEKHKAQYSVNYNIVAFVDTEGILYVIPDLSGVKKTLKREGYVERDFFVPFSNGSYPISKKAEWEVLIAEKNGHSG